MRVKYFVTSIIALSGVAEAFNLAQTQANLDYDITDDIRNQLAQTLQDPIPAAEPAVKGGPGSLPPPPEPKPRSDPIPVEKKKPLPDPAPVEKVREEKVK